MTHDAPVKMLDDLPFSGICGHYWAAIDRWRRAAGALLDAVGLRPIETPSRVVFREPPLALQGYGDRTRPGPAVLLVPAPIKRGYIFDLTPEVSVVRQFQRAGARVYLVHWQEPGAAGQRYGLADYADRLMRDCLRAVEADSGQRRVFLVGHSLGGTLAAIFAALRPERVRGLILLGSPLHFGPEAGPFGLMATIGPPAQLLTSLVGNVPGSLLSLVTYLAAPATFGWSRRMDWLASLFDPERLRLHQLVERWTLDELSIPRRLFEEVATLLYREDRFMEGGLVIGRQCVGPASIRGPLLSVAYRDCSVAPPSSVVPFLEAARNADAELLWYNGDSGVALQHVGMLVGSAAHGELWPAIVRWMQACIMK